MSSTITKTQVADKPMAAFFAQKRGEKVEMVDAWIVTGDTGGAVDPHSR